MAHIFWALLTSSRSLGQLMLGLGFFVLEEKKEIERGFEREKGCWFFWTARQNFRLQEIRPLDRSEIFTAGSQHIALHLDRSDRQSEFLIVCYRSWRNLRFLVIFLNFSSLLCWLLCMLLLVGCDILVD